MSISSTKSFIRHFYPKRPTSKQRSRRERQRRFHPHHLAIEPMTVDPPTAPRPSPGAEYLPGFLMGDLPTPNTPQPRRGGFAPQPVVPTPRDRSGAPPVRSINDDLLALSARQPLTPGTGAGVQQLSPAQLDPFYSQRESLTSAYQLDQTWVTVFGFPPASASYILLQFAQYGNILKHKMASPGNWMHLQYQTQNQARKALSKHGKVFGDGIMVGVKPCIDVNVMDGSRAVSSGFPASRYAGMRPLCPEGYRGYNRDHQMLADRQTPRRDDSIFSKVMYLFSW